MGGISFGGDCLSAAHAVAAGEVTVEVRHAPVHAGMVAGCRRAPASSTVAETAGAINMIGKGSKA